MKNTLTQKGSIGTFVIILITLMGIGGEMYLYFFQDFKKDIAYTDVSSATAVSTSSDLSNLDVVDTVSAPDISISAKTNQIDTKVDIPKVTLPPLTCPNNNCLDAYATVLRPIFPTITGKFLANISGENISNLEIDDVTVDKLIAYMVSIREQVEHPGDGSVKNIYDEFDPFVPVRDFLETLDHYNPNLRIAEKSIDIYKQTSSELGKSRILSLLERLGSDKSLEVMINTLETTSDKDLFKSALRNVIFVVENKKDAAYSTAGMTSFLFNLLEKELYTNTPITEENFKYTYILQALTRKTSTLTTKIPNVEELETIALGGTKLSIKSRLIAIYILSLNHTNYPIVKDALTKLSSDSNEKISTYTQEALKNPKYPMLQE